VKRCARFLKPEATIWQYTHGVADPTMVSPDGYSLDNSYLAGLGWPICSSTCRRLQEQRRALSDLPDVFPAHKPRFLAVWGKNDPFFLPPGARRSSATFPTPVVRFLRHRPFRAGDPCRGDRGSHPRLRSPLISQPDAAERRAKRGVEAAGIAVARLRRVSGAAACKELRAKQRINRHR
jgi:hypothetical protein